MPSCCELVCSYHLLSPRLLVPPRTLLMSNLATVLQDQGKYEHAEEVNRRALAEYEALGSSTPDTLTCMRNLATVLQDQGKYEQANEVNRRALAEYEKLSKFSSDPLLFNVPDHGWLQETFFRIYTQ
jgi:tetratricopeptide (TPR) repeat protein